jgi:Domain of Unknown Function (DUF748)
MSRRRRLLAGAVLLLLLLVGAIAIAPTVAVPWLERTLGARAGVPVGIGWLTWNPLRGRVVLHRVTVAAAPGEEPMITARAIEIDVALRDWLDGVPALDALVLREPWVGIRRTADGDVNLAVLLRGAPTEPEEAGKAAVVRIGALRIVDGSVEFHDETTTPVLQTKLYVDEAVADGVAIDLSGQGEVAIHLESRLEQEPLTLDVGYRAQGADSSLEAKLTTGGLALERAFLYVPLGWQRVSGTLATTVAYTREVKDGKLVRHRLDADARLADVVLVEPWSPEPSLRAARIRVPKASVDLLARETRVGPIEVGGFTALLLRDAKGLHVPLVAEETSAPDSAWNTKLDAITFDGGTAIARGLLAADAPALEARVRSARVRPRAGGATLTLAADAAGGRVSLDGDVGPRETTLAIGLDAVALPAFGVQAGLPVAFTAGRVDGAMRVRVPEGPVRVSGTLAVADAKSAPPAGRPTDVFAWQRLDVEVDESTVDPLAIHLASLRVDWPYLMVHRSAAGLWPFGGAGDGAAKGPPAVRIARATIANGHLEFYDTTLTPAWGVDLVGLDGTVDTLGVSPTRVRRFDVRGTVDELSPLEIGGRIGDDATALAIRVDRLLLPPLDPYLVPLLGYRATAGTAEIESDVTIRGDRLDADTDVALSRLALESTGEDRLGLKVPLGVALALMKDTSGDVHLHLPIQGDLGRGSWEVAGVLRDALPRAIAGAVKAPITLLGSVFRREEKEQFDLRPVPFAPGSAELGTDGAARIAQVAKLLDRYPTLNAVLEAEITPADRTALGSPASSSRISALAQARAQAVATALQERHGIPPKRVSIATPEPRPPRPDDEPGVAVLLRAG